MSSNIAARSIRDRKDQIRTDRRNERIKLMADYDRTIYYPALKANIKECEALGHELGGYTPNGLGNSYRDCKNCGATIFDEEEF